MIKRLLLGVLILWGSYSQAASLLTDLNTLDKETLTAEFLALNCLMVAQKSKLITTDCRQANRLVVYIDKQLVTLIDYLTKDGADLGNDFYVAMSKIKQYRTRLQKVNNNLNLVKKITGIYNWTDKLAPSYYQYKKE
ncbi:hypothetical protein [Legionella sp. km772]|uniref:hypothetical protein n=1 Tax=Legionella sp. km772 TaxID=2498111 RepID=UPI000F8CA8E1|nr:hypothetical protein [Legionella sp. km772]RUR12574.1 hypothetical protein ELY15_04600 [Legionella sp. km772]